MKKFLYFFLLYTIALYNTQAQNITLETKLISVANYTKFTQFPGTYYNVNQNIFFTYDYYRGMRTRYWIAKDINDTEVSTADKSYSNSYPNFDVPIIEPEGDITNRTLDVNNLVLIKTMFTEDLGNYSGSSIETELSFTNLYIGFEAYAPGKWFTFFTENGSSTSYFKMRYSIPKPKTPFHTENGVKTNLTSFCTDRPFTIATDVLPNNTGLIYNWQYKRNGIDTDWQDLLLNTSRETTISNPLLTLFNNNLSEATLVQFRAKAKSVENLESVFADPVVYTFLPAAPIGISNNFIITPSCNYPYTGVINIYANGISTPTDYIQWIIKEGTNQPLGCTITNIDNVISSNCGLNGKSSQGLIKVPKQPEDAPIVIPELKPGNYTLYLINKGGTVGLCYSPTPINITIPAYTNPSLQSVSATNITCNGAGDGTISFKGVDGAPTGYMFNIKKAGVAVKQVSSANSNMVTVDNLSAGMYIIELINTCTLNGGLPPTTSVTITEPVKVNATTIVTQPTCTSPNNGVINISATTGNGNYAYSLYKDGALVNPATVTTSTTTAFNNLASGSYKVVVLDADRLSCPGFEQTFTLNAVPPIVRSSLTQTVVSCFGGTDGSLQISGTGSTGNLTYTLTNTATNQILNSDAGSFNNLTAGNYIATIKNKPITGCNDVFTENITIAQRPEIVINVQNENVTCKDSDNGILKALVSGGSNSFSYQWQQLVNGNFVNYGVNAATISGVEPGTYKLIVTDNNATGCSKTSAQTIIAEPNELIITNVTPSQAICFGDVAFISVTASGGNGNYSYYYKLAGSAEWIMFSANTPLSVAGTYSIRATDSKGCETIYNSTVTLNFSTTVLSSTELLSNYSGVNISCFGGNNGSITVTATGGQAPYRYALDNDNYSTNNVITGINAGMHTLYIKDARNCIITKNYNFTQSTSPINVQIINVTGVACANEATGAISVNATGGAGSFTYSINNGTPQATGNFTGLTGGTYTIKAFDANNCDKTISVNVNASNPPITIESKTINNISCFGANDGSIVINAIGGSAPLRYAWQGQTSTTNTLSNIRAGSYRVTITDAIGCTKTEATTITEPTALTLSTQVQALCTGTNNGIISIMATGGTMPYQYSINNGTSFLSTSTFSSLAVGMYNIVVKDSKNCEQSKTVVITENNVRPTVSFLVATRQNEKDTLAIKETCFPTPEEVSWRFHPDAIVLTPTNIRDPKIKFNTTGLYWAEMTGKFGDCYYTIRKDININPYDPNAGPSTILPASVIKSIKVAPNPNNGVFNLIIELNRRQLVQIKIINVVGGNIAYSKNYDRTLLINDNINIPAIAASGTYIVRVITENDSRDLMIVVSK